MVDQTAAVLATIRDNADWLSHETERFWEYNEDTDLCELHFDDDTLAEVVGNLMVSRTTKIGAGSESFDAEQVRKALLETIVEFSGAHVVIHDDPRVHDFLEI